MHFLKRHPEISRRRAQNLGTHRATISPESVRRWFGDLESYLRKEGYDDILKDLSRIYNCDESGFPLSPNTGFVLVPRVASHVYQLSSNTRAQITILASVSASGHVPAPDDYISS